MSFLDYSADQALANRLIGLPPKIARYHDLHGLPELVLHELGHEGGVGFDKALYLIDNPDFDCVKGVAGYCKDECKFHQSDIWDDPNQFAQHMKQAHFCTHARGLAEKSILRSLGHPAEQLHEGHLDHQTLQVLGEKLGITHPVCVAWPMRHGNHGVLILNADGCKHAQNHALLTQCGSLLSLC